MAGGFRTIFKRINGRVIPIRESLNNAPSEVQRVIHLQKIRAALKNEVTSADPLDRKFTAKFYKAYKGPGSAAGVKIAKRIAKIARMKKG